MMIDLDELERLEQAATPNNSPAMRAYLLALRNAAPELFAELEQARENYQQRDAQYHAAMTSIEEWHDEVRKLRAENARLRAEKANNALEQKP